MSKKTSAPAPDAAGRPDRAKPIVVMYHVTLSVTGGGENALTLLSSRLAARGYPVRVLTRPPLDRGHRYVRTLKQAGVPIAVLPRFSDLRALRLARRAFCRDGGPGAGVGRVGVAAVERVKTALAKLERARLHRLLEASRAAAQRSGRPLILHVWGPAALAPRLLRWAATKSVPAIYHETGEADAAYVRTWAIEPTLAQLALARAVVCC